MSYNLVHRFFLLPFLILSSPAITQPPPHFYDPVEGFSGQALLEGLHDLTRDHIVLEYYTLIGHFRTTDRRPDGTVWDLYSDIPGEPPPYSYYFSSGAECGYFNGEGDCYDREHTWPKSWFGGQVYPMYSDLFIVYPADGYVNSCRSNYPYGEAGDPEQVFLAGHKLGHCVTPGYQGTVFEPVDDYKGDLARTYFYVSARYYSEDQDWPGSGMVTGSLLKPWALGMMLRWSSSDPVSQKEVDRNNLVFLLQNNRNPFIDHPEFANRIWGNPEVIREEGSGSAELHLFPNPAEDQCSFRLPGGYSEDPVVRIVSSEGKTFLFHTMMDKDLLTIKIPDLTPGIYLVILITEKRIFSGKLVKH